MDEFVNRPVPGGRDVDTAIEHARETLAALLCGPVGYPKGITEARALLSTLLDHRFALAAPRIDVRDADAVAAARADRDEAIAVTGALLYSLPPGDSAWPEVALTVGRLSYDRYRDPWPDAQSPDPDDLDAACDLLLRAACYEEADERTALYMVLALRDRQRLMPCPSDANALARWTRRLHAGSYDAGFGPAAPYDQARNPACPAQAGSWIPRPSRPLLLTLTPALT